MAIVAPTIYSVFSSSFVNVIFYKKYNVLLILKIIYIFIKSAGIHDYLLLRYKKLSYDPSNCFNTAESAAQIVGPVGCP